MSLTNATGSTGIPASAVALNANKNVVQSTTPDHFVDRRRSQSDNRDRAERRQFGSSHSGLSEAGRELALAIDQYKIQHHRRYLTCDEMLLVLTRLGYVQES